MERQVIIESVPLIKWLFLISNHPFILSFGMVGHTPPSPASFRYLLSGTVAGVELAYCGSGRVGGAPAQPCRPGGVPNITPFHLNLLSHCWKPGTLGDAKWKGGHIYGLTVSIRWEYREETNTSALPAGSLLNSAKRGYHRESGELQKKSVLPGSFISTAYVKNIFLSTARVITLQGAVLSHSSRWIRFAVISTIREQLQDQVPFQHQLSGLPFQRSGLQVKWY